MSDFLQQLPGVIYELTIRPDGSKTFTFISENCQEILGLSAKDILKNASLLDNAIIEEDRESFERSSKENYKRQSLWNWEGRVSVRNEIRWIEARSNFEKRDNGVFRKGIILDITERKRREQEAEAVSKRNETMFTQLFNSAPMGLVLLDEHGKVELVNEGFREMFGYDLGALRGMNLNDFIVPEDLKNEGIDLNNLITANKIISVVTRRRHKAGHIVDVLLYGVPVELNHRTIGIYGVYVDITERKKVEEELKVRNIELDNFVYKVSHDLRAPLSSILGLVNLARLPGNDDNPMDYINIIGSKVEDLDHFIGDVLSHSKNLKMDVSIMRVDFNTIISRTFTDLSYLEGAADMMIYRRVDENDFYSDPWRISEIFRNLVSNAIKYRQITGPAPEIRIEINCGETQTEIIFADNGIGIEKENLTKIFEMFYRATVQSDGSGIGLYIVKNAVEKLGGTISVHSEIGVGTTFTIILPNRSAERTTENLVAFAVQKQ
ncbi:MAG TPA: PAS domain S-box protein [Cyclobacteriaceae bacterium]|nr:PAS domain S-box protein [Cyclobacteriaceae bacterium]